MSSGTTAAPNGSAPNAAHYRIFSYSFSIRCQQEATARYIARVLRAFAVAPEPRIGSMPETPGQPPEYTMTDRGRRKVSRYQLLYNDVPIIESNQESEILHHLFWHVNTEALQHAGSFLLVHAGSVVSPEGAGVILPARSGSGKTTLTAGLVESGFGYLSDEAAAIDPVTLKVYPYPKALTFKAGLAAVFPRLVKQHTPFTDGQWHVLPEEIRRGARAVPASARLVVGIRYEKGAATEVSPMTRAQAVIELSQNVMNTGVYGSRALLLLASLARGITAYHMVSGDLPEAVAAVTDLARTAAAAAPNGRYAGARA